jgi:orotidine-5'-phosphate decarboxylase
MLALDVASTDEAKRLLDITGPYLAAVKIGWQLILRATEGPGVVEVISRAVPLPILVDAKIHDASHIAVEMIRSFRDRGARAITVWGDVGPRVLSQCIEECPDIDLFLLTGLTALDEEDAAASVSSAMETARLCGCLNLQVPGNYPRLVRQVREALGPSACLIACGIGAQGGESGGAATVGADYEIVGRDICLAPDPRSAASLHDSAIKDALSRRAVAPIPPLSF